MKPAIVENCFPGCGEEDIAGRTGLKITALRKILYRLRDINLVEASSQEREDGSLTFYWLLRPNQLSTYVASERRLKLEQLLAGLSFERSHIFLFCERDNARMTYEEVMQGQTVCPTCHGPLQSFENANTIQSIEAQIKDLQPPHHSTRVKHENRHSVTQESENTSKSSTAAPQAGAGEVLGFGKICVRF